MIPGPPARLALSGARVLFALAGKRQIADRNHPRSVGFPGSRRRQMPPAIAEGIELFGIAEVEAGLLSHPFAQALFQGALGFRIEGTERQCVLAVVMGHHQGARIFLLDRDDRGRQADADGGLGHSPTNGKVVATPSTAMLDGPIAASAVTMRPPRPNASSAWRTRSALGWAWGARRRIAKAISTSRFGPSRSHRTVKADAMERLMPAQQWIKKGAPAS